MSKQNKTPLFFVQWAIGDECHHAQYQTFDLLKVIKKIEETHGLTASSVEYLNSDVWLVCCDYMFFNISVNGMEKLIDCEAI